MLRVGPVRSLWPLSKRWLPQGKRVSSLQDLVRFCEIRLWIVQHPRLVDYFIGVFAEFCLIELG